MSGIASGGKHFALQYYDGSLVNWLGAIDWRFAKNWVTGVGYRYVNYKVGVTKSDFTGQVDYRFKGPTIYVWANF